MASRSPIKKEPLRNLLRGKPVFFFVAVAIGNREELRWFLQHDQSELRSGDLRN